MALTWVLCGDCLEWTVLEYTNEKLHCPECVRDEVIDRTAGFDEMSETEKWDVFRLVSGL